MLNIDPTWKKCWFFCVVCSNKHCVMLVALLSLSSSISYKVGWLTVTRCLHPFLACFPPWLPRKLAYCTQNALNPPPTAAPTNRLYRGTWLVPGPELPRVWTNGDGCYKLIAMSTSVRGCGGMQPCSNPPANILGCVQDAAARTRPADSGPVTGEIGAVS